MNPFKLLYELQAGAKVNIIAGGATPLHIAADIGNAELISCLVKAGADTNVTDEVSLENTSVLFYILNYITIMFTKCQPGL